MVTFTDTWFIDNYIDYEQKKYMFLAWSQQITAQFKEYKLYPAFSELQHHFNNLKNFKTQKEKFEKSLKKEIKELDLLNYKIVYHEVIKTDKHLDELNKTIEYALEKLDSKLERAFDFYEEIYGNFSITEIGITSNQKEHGILIINNHLQKLCYEFTDSRVIPNFNEEYKRIHLKLFKTYKKSEQPDIIKENYCKSENCFVPCYYIETLSKYPLQETILPVAAAKLQTLITTID